MKLYNVEHDLWWHVTETDIDGNSVRRVCRTDGRSDAEQIAQMLNTPGASVLQPPLSVYRRLILLAALCVTAIVAQVVLYAAWLPLGVPATFASVWAISRALTR